MGTFFKYVFIIFVIALIAFSVYTFYENKDDTTANVISEQVEEVNNLLSDIRLGIVDYDTFNPILSKNKNVQEISKLVFDGLLTIDKDYQIQAALATEWSQIGDLSYIIKLREDVKWHDGSEFTAEDIKFTVDKLKDPSIDSVYKANVANVVELQIVDLHTVKITLNEKIAFFEYNLIFPILSSKYYENENFITTVKNKIPLGTGEYKIASSDNAFISLKENTEWWNKEDSKKLITTININMYETMGEMYNAFKSNNIDFISTTNVNFDEYIGKIGYSYKEFPGREFDYISLNNSNDIISSSAVRKAISLSIDKNNIITNEYNNNYYVAETPIDYTAMYTKLEGTSYDTEQAKQILIDDGWAYKNGLWQKTQNGKYLKLNLTFVVNSSYSLGCTVADLIKADLEKIGIKVTVKKVNSSQYVSYITNKNYDMMLVAKNRSISPDMTDYMGPGNISNYSNEEVNNILEWLKGMNNDKVIKEKYDRILKIYREEVPFISLYFNKNTVAYSSNLSGDIAPTNYNLFYNIGYWKRQR